MSRCDDPTCWRTPHDRSDHTDPIVALDADIARVEDLIEGAPDYLASMYRLDRALLLRIKASILAERVAA